MNFLIRVDASIEIGSGHIMRCLTLADELRERGANVTFLCREFTGHLCDRIENHGYRVLRITNVDEVEPLKDAEYTEEMIRNFHERIDWLIVDHYNLDASWESKFRSSSTKVWVIDDLANRMHDCDVLLDQNLYEHMDQRYYGLVPSNCITLLGPTYAMLRPEFSLARKLSYLRDGIVKRIFVFFGGTDPTNETTKAIQALQLLQLEQVHIDVVVGQGNPNKGQVERLCKEMENTAFHCQIDYMAQLMNRSDLVIGAGGTNTWERASLGLPAITISVAHNQLEVSASMAKAGAICDLGWHEEVTVERLCDAIHSLLNDPSRLLAMGERSYTIMGEDSGTCITTFIEKLMGENRWRN
jgi:UDP-2,4-diacetamido-2,4,6-trideoxy-beta-L-altropyranose hydrolase